MVEENNHNWFLAMVVSLVIHFVVMAALLNESHKTPMGTKVLVQQGIEVNLGMMGDTVQKKAPKPVAQPPKPEPKPEPKPKVEPVKPKQTTAVVVKKPEKKKHHKPKKKKKLVKHKKVKPEKMTKTSTQTVTNSDVSGGHHVSTGVGNSTTSGEKNTSAQRSYEGMILALLLKQKNYPRASVRRGEEGVVTLYFKLDRTGKVLSYRIVKSSGHRRLDEEVIRMVERVKFPSFLKEMTQSSLSVKVPISFSLTYE